MPPAIFFDLGDTLVTASFAGNPPRLRFEPMEGAADLLERLGAAGYRLGIISNTGDLTGASVNQALADAGLEAYFEGALRLYSADLPDLRPKPHPDLFEEARSRSGGGRTLFVGENAAERATASGLGFESLDVPEVEAVLLPSPDPDR